MHREKSVSVSTVHGHAAIKPGKTLKPFTFKTPELGEHDVRIAVTHCGFPAIAFHPRDLVAHELSITGSFIGNRAAMQEMLKFAQAHGIKPKIELMPMSRVNKAMRTGQGEQGALPDRTGN